jgi:hypothetical protein
MITGGRLPPQFAELFVRAPDLGELVEYSDGEKEEAQFAINYFGTAMIR